MRKSSYGQPEDDLKIYVAGLSDPMKNAFVIGDGKRIAEHRFQFPVALYVYFNGDSKGMPFASTIEIIRENADWRVDKLPATNF